MIIFSPLHIPNQTSTPEQRRAQTRDNGRREGNGPAHASEKRLEPQQPLWMLGQRQGRPMPRGGHELKETEGRKQRDDARARSKRTREGGRGEGGRKRRGRRWRGVNYTAGKREGETQASRNPLGRSTLYYIILYYIILY